MILATEVPDVVFAAMLTFGSLVALGFAGWVGSMMVKSSATLAAVMAELKDHDRRLGSVEELVKSHPEVRRK